MRPMMIFSIHTTFHHKGVLVLDATLGGVIARLPYQTSSSLDLVRTCKGGVPDYYDTVDDCIRDVSYPYRSSFEDSCEAQTTHRVVKVFGGKVRLGAPFDGDKGESDGHDEAGEDGTGNPIGIHAVVAVVVLAVERSIVSVAFLANCIPMGKWAYVAKSI